MVNRETLGGDEKLAIWYRPEFQVIATWIWFVAGIFFGTLIISAVYDVSFTRTWEILIERAYLAAYIEIVAVGLLPVIFTLISKDDLAVYGLRREGLGKSLLLSVLCGAVLFGVFFLLRGPTACVFPFCHSHHLDFPLNIWYATLGIFAYGPLEVFFVFWLVVNTDRVFKSAHKTVSLGLIITVVVFGLAHLVTALGGILNAIGVMVTFLVLGLIYKHTKNSIGPMIVWTLMNGQVWYFVHLL